MEEFFRTARREPAGLLLAAANVAGLFLVLSLLLGR